MATWTLYHNPRCSKSRAALELLRARGIEPDVIEYLEAPPSRARLAELLRQTGGDVRGLVRSDEPGYAALGLPADPAAAPDAVLDAIAANPALLQRPIVVHGDRARVGRPPEAVLELVGP